MKQALQDFVRQVGDLPSLPVVYEKLNRAVQDDRSSIDTISEILHQDQSLTLRLLKLANSALYGYPTQIGTIEDAVQLIGLRELQSLALSTCVISVFGRLPPGRIDAVTFWQHSVACGIASLLLAEEQHDPAPERFFVGGLLHDIGRLLLLLKAPRASAEIWDRCERQEALCGEVEMAVLGFDHAMLGAELISSWKLPPSLREMVRCHHSPMDSTIAFEDACIVHHGDFLVSALEYGNSGEEFIVPLQESSAGKNRWFEEGRLEGMVQELEEKCEHIFAILTNRV